MNTRTSRLIEETFDKPFDLNRYRAFAQELFKQVEAKPFTNAGNIIPEGYREHIASFSRVGTYTDPQEKEIDVLYIKLRQAGQMVRARSLQRNFVARHLKKRDKEGALVAFYVDDTADWRLSLVWRSEVVTFDEEKERLKIEDVITPARRSSYLLGANEPSHTAKRQLLPLLDERDRPTLAQLQNAFSVETVTKTFFNQYKALYLRLYEALGALVKTDGTVRENFEKTGIDLHNFAKKLLGQIVFLYFLQKKGWLGVPQGQDWEAGSPHFLRDLFKGEYVPYNNFFNDVLEPLFYQALAEQRADDWYGRLNCRIPFLNGGLFEPMNGYDWEGTILLLPNTLFWNDEMSDEGDEGTGILNVFDRYNFTVHEEEPLEKEVAVDPEMLGKVFENLLDVVDRKSKGAFYTPREIVHYMCQESLITYLDTAVNTSTDADPIVPREELTFLIRHSGAVKADRDGLKAAGQLTTDTYQLPSAVRSHAARLDDALEIIKVCDPAIGSGAFPVGMLTEIVRARTVLQQANGTREPDVYALKRHAIQYSLYGVDLDAGAVDIAKLRLWLSLVVDEDDFRTIKPLPNLSYKIAHGNSVTGSVTYGTLFDSNKRQRVRKLKRAYFEATDPAGKKTLKTEIDTLLSEMSGADTFDFGAVFSEVMEDESAGFDIVIGNPPYVRHELIKEMKPTLKKMFGGVYVGTADLYVYFYKRAIDLLKPHGTLAYITSNKFMRAGYGKKLRTFLAQETTLHSVIDFGDLPVFDATAYPTIVITQATTPSSDTKLAALTVNSLNVLYRLPQEIDSLAWPMPQTALSLTGWLLAEPDVLALMTKLRQTGQQLKEYVDGKYYRGIVTGLNEAFVINSETREHLISDDPNSKSVIKPWVRGRDVKRWHTDWANLYLLYIPWEFPLEQYPAIKNHLQTYKPRLEKRPEVRKGRLPWYALSRYASEYVNDFENPKVFVPAITKAGGISIDNNGIYGNDKTSICVTDDNYYIGALLNSNVILWLLTQIAAERMGGYFEFKPMYVTQMPIPTPTSEQKTHAENLVQRLLDTKKQGDQVTAWEHELNALVYDLYNLTPDEINLIENSLNRADKKKKINSASNAISQLKGVQ